MPSRRYYIAIAPVSHINGKMAPVAVKVKNTATPPVDPSAGFWYGYKPRWTHRSFYGIRTNPRNLTTNPYTADELDHRLLFTNTLNAVNAAWSVNSKKQKAIDEYYELRQPTATPKGYATSVTYANGGVWPARWD